jgi:Flp pilus assembly protein TadG
MALNTVVLLGMAAMALDLGHGWVVKQELQNVADSAALAGARQLGQIYDNLPTATDQQNYFLTGADKQAILDQVNSLSPNSQAGGTLIDFASTDIIVGTWDSVARTLTPVPVDSPGSLRPTAVGVVTRRDETLNEPLTTFFAGLLGKTGLNINTTATAALTTISTAAPGGLGAPFAISEQWFANGGACGSAIQFSPTGSDRGCAGWHTFTDSDSSGNNLKTIIGGMEDGSFTTPEAIAGETQFYFNGGDIASAFSNMEALYAANAVGGSWTVLIPVYQATDCSNPSGPILIVGFVTATITQVIGPPDRLINATVNCDSFGSGRGDGTTGGTAITPLGTIPGLVA